MSGRPPVTGGILAGGRGSRMGGIDKGLALLEGHPLAAWVLERLRPQVEHLLISANRNRDQYARLGVPVVADRLTDFQGPLAGIAALLAACEDDWLVTVPCDAPHPPPDLVERLWQARAEAGATLALAHDGRRLQPAHALVPRRLLPVLEADLAHGERRLQAWLEAQGAAIADFSDRPEAFCNLNRPEDYAALAKAGP